MRSIRKRKAIDNFFKFLIHIVIAFAFLVFLSLFSFVFKYGVAGFFDNYISIDVNFSKNDDSINRAPDKIFSDNRNVLSSGALKILYRKYKADPKFVGTMYLPALPGHGESRFNWDFITSPSSAYAESTGIFGALVGSIYVLIISFLMSVPIGVASGVFLEELSPKNSIFRSLEVFIWNLAAVPSIIYGLLGLFCFVQVLDLPRSSALVGGLTLGLMSLPSLIVGTRLALKAVPVYIRDSAKALGASDLQAIIHHVLPMAFPYLMTNILIAMARVCGETAPLLIVGLTAFSPVVPIDVIDSATTLPVQIYMWFKYPDPAFMEKGAAAILVLALFLVVLTVIALRVRKSYEQKNH